MKNIKDYFIRLWRAIWNIKIEVVETEIEVVKEVEKPKSGHQVHLEKMEHLNHLDADRIREIMDMTILNERDKSHDVQELINNRKAINEYKDWYVRLVGYNPPPEELQKLLNADHKLDIDLMNKLLNEMYQSDVERFKKIEVRNMKVKETTSSSNHSMDMERISGLETPIKNYTDLKKILTETKNSEIWKRLEEDVVEKPEWKPEHSKIPQGILDKMVINEMNDIKTIKNLR